MPEKSQATTRRGRAALGDGITISQLRAMVKGRVIAPGDAHNVPPRNGHSTLEVL